MTSEIPARPKLSCPPCEPLPKVLATRAGFLLNRTADRIRQMTEEALQPLDLQPKHYGLMAVIKAGGPTTQQAIGEVLKVDRTTMVMLVDDAEAKDLVIRNPHPTDRRCHLLSLSDNGEKTFRKAHRLVKQAEDEFFDSLGKEDQTRLIDLLGKLFQSLEQETLPAEKLADSA